MPSFIDVLGLKSIHFCNLDESDSVAATSPSCIGSNIFCALIPNSSSIAWIYSIKGVGLEFPTLNTLCGAQLFEGSGYSVLNVFS